MKYAVILGDGMAGYPLPERDNKTTLQLAHTPHMDALAKTSEVGLCRTVPEGMKPGSDVANLSVLGYDPRTYYTGRSPLEAVSIGIDLKETDVTLRCNLVTLSDAEPYEQKTMLDYSAGEISTAEAAELIAYLKAYFDSPAQTLYAGVSYRHCLVMANGVTGHDLTPPHDISDQPIQPYLPKGPNAAAYLNLMKRSYELLKDHPVNRRRMAEGKHSANSVWLWGEGTKPALPSFFKTFGLKGGIISAVDLVKGLGILAGMQILPVEGMTGNWDTNFAGKAKAAADALKGGLDLVYIHMEGPDECGHHGDIEKKIYSIEQIDEKVVGYLTRELESLGDYTLLICPDHPTPIAKKTHVSDPVPYLIYRSNHPVSGPDRYDEASAAQTGIFVEHGYCLMQKLLHGDR